MFKKVLIANRGEIAVRIARSLRELGIRSVAVFSDADRGALHVRVADEAYAIGPSEPAQSYLRIDRLIDTARQAGCDGLHPGYGFLSESSELAEECSRANVTFIGPPASAMRAMGLKLAARAAMVKAGVPVVPGGPTPTLEDARSLAQTLGYPVMIKPSAGGGGKGMRRVECEQELAGAYARAKSEAERAFLDGTLYLEKCLVSPRHVEIQVLGDQHGHLVHLFERDCSLQRRHQKIVEETPSPAAPQALVRQMGEVSLKGAAEIGYFSAGTFEYLLDQSGAFYFLEMNTRLQVEHPITELTTGIDLVREMVRIAAGEELGYDQAAVVRRGAAIECRIYAEDPRQGFLPSPGTLTTLSSPGGPGVREDRGVYEGDRISDYYDPLISKLSVWAPTREQAISRMKRALHECVVAGVHTNLDFLRALLAHSTFVSGNYSTSAIDEHRAELVGEPGLDDEQLTALVAGAAVAFHESVQSAPSLSVSTLSPWVSSQRAALRKR